MADGSVSYGSVPFKEQIAFFRRKTNTPTERWTDLWQEEHDHAFMVAGANRIDLLVDLRQAVDKAIAEGAGLEAFRRDFDQIVAKHGWSYTGGRDWRTRVIFETNLRTSYAAGRYAQLQALKQVRPFWRYRHSDSVQHPRPQHLAWNGLVLHADDPWWQTHYPPNGWGCQCTVEALNLRDLKRLGKDGPDQAPPIDLQDVVVGQRGPAPTTVQTPAGVDPGFGYAPGRSAYEQLAQGVVTKAAELPATTAAKALAPILALPRAQQALDAAYGAWQAEVLTTRQARNLTVPVGALDQELVQRMTAEGLEPATAPIVARDVEVLHALRDAKSTTPSGKPVALTPDELAHLPNLLASPKAVLLDRADGTLLYVVDASDRREAGKVVVAINYRLKTETGKRLVNSFRTASLLDLVDVEAGVKSGELVLLRGSLA
ncbi:phage minor head protein [Fulvimonas yonginensis]|uniref:Phage minor head protein n=1 Tax=Fulvimonas yonginensis TaxID=1495200 RepID=A0ABU8JB22_9GAMM